MADRIRIRTVILVAKSRYVKKVFYTMSGKATEKINSIIDKKGALYINDFEKIRFAHDYLVKHIDYDEDYMGKGLHEAIFEKRAVCLGYTEAFYVFMKTLGIPVKYVVSSKGTHIWNMVRLDGEWYHVDVTWDDPSEIKLFTKKHPTYNFFMQSTSQLLKKENSSDHKYKGNSFPPCKSKTYDNPGATKDYTEVIPGSQNRYSSSSTFHPWKNGKYLKD